MRRSRLVERSRGLHGEARLACNLCAHIAGNAQQPVVVRHVVDDQLGAVVASSVASCLVRGVSVALVPEASGLDVAVCHCG